MQLAARNDDPAPSLEEAFEHYVDAIVAGLSHDRQTRAPLAQAAQSARSLAFRLLKTPLFHPYMVAWNWPTGIDDTGWEAVAIPSGSGAVLSGRFANARGRTKGVVVCAHPMRRSAKGYFLASGRAEMLRRNGYDVLLFDFNGFGESPHGDFNYPLDVLAAGEFARRIAGGLPVHVLAASFGAGWTICAATREHPFDSIALEGAFTTPQEFYARHRFARFALDVLWRFFPDTRKTMIPLESIERLAGEPRVLFIGCLADATTSPAMTRRLFDRCNLSRARREVWFVQGAAHIRSFETDPAGFEERVIGFFDARAAATAGV
jgi:pimeloyl-ACP methyl ester carboxylesterase